MPIMVDLKRFIFRSFPIYIHHSSDPRVQGAPFVYWSGSKNQITSIQKNMIYNYVKENFQHNVSLKQVSRILEHGN
jgi:hypothetical protein